MFRVLIQISLIILLALPSAASKRWSGSAWVDTTAKRWSGSAWVNATEKRFNGTTWDTLGASCTPTETPETSCSDTLDNDCDGLTDSADSDCAGAGAWYYSQSGTTTEPTWNTTVSEGTPVGIGAIITTLSGHTINSIGIKVTGYATSTGCKISLYNAAYEFIAYGTATPVTGYMDVSIPSYPVTGTIYVIAVCNNTLTASATSTLPHNGYNTVYPNYTSAPGTADFYINDIINTVAVRAYATN